MGAQKRGIYIAMLLVDALIVLLVVLLVVRVCAPPAGRDAMAVSPEAVQVTAEAARLFAAHGEKLPYKTYKASVPDADPVQYTRVRELFHAGALTPERVQAVL